MPETDDRGYPMQRRELRRLLSYAFGADVPPRVVQRLLAARGEWDPVFRDRLDELAYEFRPDLAVWEIVADDDGALLERRAPLLD